MSITVPLALFGWIPAILVLFGLLPARRAAVTAFVAGWLFLPNAGYAFEGLPEYTKMSATCLGVLLGTIIFDSARILSFRPRLIDLPMLLWCLCPFASSLSGGFGWYGGLSCSIGPIVSWGMPYFIGRLYFRDLAAMRELALGIFFGGLVYVPLIVFEARMGGQLHPLVYGFEACGSGRHYGMFGMFPFQPRVFMQNALALNMYMAAAAVIGVGLWKSGAARSFWGFGFGWLTLAVIGGSVLSKSLGANLLMLGGIAIIVVLARFRSYVLLVLVLLAAPAYMTTRAAGIWSGEGLVNVVSTFASSERTGSLAGRLFQEDRLISRALEKPVFGWAGWGLNLRCIDAETGAPVIAVPDGLWVIVLGINGIVGLVLLSLALLLPLYRFMRLSPSATAMCPDRAPVAAMAVVMAIYIIDCLFNAMINPILVLTLGAMTGFTGRAAVRKRASVAWRRGTIAAAPPQPNS